MSDASPSPKPAEFDGFAAGYDAALNKGISLSGEAKDYFIEGRIKWLKRCVAARSSHGVPGEDENVANFSRPRVIDFGCGTGAAFSVLRGLLDAREVIGIDVSAAELEIARKENPWALAYQPEQAPADLSADIAYSNGTFHHIPPAERAGVVAKIFHQLKPGGLFALWENNPWNPGTRMVMRRIPFDRDAITLSAFETRRMLIAAGFELIRTDFLFIFPRFLAPLRAVEPALSRLPIGAQYQVLCRRPVGR
jgi:SAM-dependent methyltransferase